MKKIITKLRVSFLKILAIVILIIVPFVILEILSMGIVFTFTELPHDSILRKVPVQIRASQEDLKRLILQAHLV